MKTYKGAITKIIRAKFTPVIEREAEKMRDIAYDIYLQHVPDNMKNGRIVNSKNEYTLIFRGENMLMTGELRIRYPKKHGYNFNDYHFCFMINPDADQAKIITDQYFAERRIRNAEKMAAEFLTDSFSYFETESDLAYAFPELIEYFNPNKIDLSGEIELTDIQKNRVNMVNDFFESHLR